jgi:hypothetical protein
LPVRVGLLIFLSKPKGKRRRNGEQRKKRRAKKEPGWTMQIHKETVLTTTATASYLRSKIEFEDGPGGSFEVYCLGSEAQYF